MPFWTGAKSLKGYWPVSDRILLVKLEGKPMNINIIQVYAPTPASSDEDIDAFYEELEQSKKQFKSQDPVVVMGDLNAKVRSGKLDEIVGPHGLGDRNERGERLIEWAQVNSGQHLIRTTTQTKMDMEKPRGWQ